MHFHRGSGYNSTPRISGGSRAHNSCAITTSDGHYLQAFQQHGTTDAVGLCALTCMAMGRDQTDFTIHLVQLCDQIFFVYVRDHCNPSNKVKDRKPSFLLNFYYICPPLRVTQSYSKMCFALTDQILLGWMRPAFRPLKSLRTLTGRKRSLSNCALLNRSII